MDKMNQYSYAGSELDLFTHAVNWKAYWSSLIKKHIKGDILEVGAGNGNNTQILFTEEFSRWVSLEPDKELTNQLRRRFSSNDNSGNIEVINGTISSLGNEEKFDTIIYIDVLEHIEDDKEELRKVSIHLKPGGNIIILSPALQQLYSEFDKDIGHFRRYTKRSIEKIVPDNTKIVSLKYLDSIGVIASLANKIFLKQSIPDLKQIKLWDRMIIPCSKRVDRLLCYCYGKSILAVLYKEI